MAPVETNVTSCNALTGNAALETESVDDNVRQPQFSTELDIEDGKIFQISENSFASSNPFVIMVETIEDLCQESIAEKKRKTMIVLLMLLTLFISAK